jgi:sugar phosphate isomerase/epimerase
VNLDPANIVWAQRDPVEAVTSLADHIVHTHAKDIVFTEAGGNAGQSGVRDVPAGEGSVGYPAYLSALAATGYDGYLTVEMHIGAQSRRRQAVEAADNLRSMLAAEPVR